MDVQCKLAHELNNAFAVIAGHVDFLSDYSHQEPAISAHVVAIREALWRAANMVHDCQCSMARDSYVQKKPSGRAEAGRHVLVLETANP